MSKYLTRQLDLIPLSVLDKKINVIGVGAIGSFTVLSLAKMGFSDITVFDDDTISDENMNCQFYRHKDIGKEKVYALYDLVKDFTGVEITCVPRRWAGEKLQGIVITSVDNMAVRKQIWETHKSSYAEWIVDPRMSAEYALLYVVNPKCEKDRATYEKVLYSDAESVQERCTAKSTMYTVGMISGLVAKAVKSLLTSEQYPRIAQWDIGQDNLDVFRGGKHDQEQTL